MNWKQPRGLLYCSVKNFEKIGSKVGIDKKQRDAILKENDYSCRFCGGIYPKYLNTIEYEENKFDVSCRLCYLINNLNCVSLIGSTHYNKEIKLYYSELSQLEIVKKTVDYILKYEFASIPSPIDIDENVCLSPISFFEYVNLLLLNNEKVNKILLNYKIFFSKPDITFLSSNYGTTGSLFTYHQKNNEAVQEEIYSDTNKADDLLTLHELTSEETILLNKVFE